MNYAIKEIYFIYIYLFSEPTVDTTEISKCIIFN